PWAKGETCRDLIEDRAWLKTLAFPKVEKKSGDEPEVVARDYVVEVSGKRFEVKVHGEATETVAAPAAAPRPKRAARGASGGGGGDTLSSPLQGNVFKVLVEEGASVEGGRSWPSSKP